MSVYEQRDYISVHTEGDVSACYGGLFTSAVAVSTSGRAGIAECIYLVWNGFILWDGRTAQFT